MLPPDKDWSMKRASEMPPSNFSRRRLSALSIKAESSPDPEFLDIERAHDLEVEAQALRMYLIDHQVKYNSSVDEALISWHDITEEEKDFFRLAIEQVLSLTDRPDDVFDHLASELAFNQS